MRVFNQRRIAFVFCPHLPETTRLDTMPFAAHIVRQLATSGWHIDVFHWSKLDLSDNTSFSSDNIHYKYVSMYTTRSKMKLIELTLRFARYTTYKCVFSVGLIGSYIGGIISAASRCPFVLLNDAFPSMYGQSRCLPLETREAPPPPRILSPPDQKP